MPMSISIFFLFILAVSQDYETETHNEYVIRGNAALLKCGIPSYIADFIDVESWHDSDGIVYTYSTLENGMGRRKINLFLLLSHLN